MTTVGNEYSTALVLESQGGTGADAGGIYV